MAEQDNRAVNCVIDVWKVDDKSAFETQMISCGLHRPTGSFYFNGRSTSLVCG